MKNSYAVFQLILHDTENAAVVYSYLKNTVCPPFDYSDLLRWQWAQGVSALDKFIHDIVRAGMLEIYMGKREATPRWSSFPISIELHQQMQDNPAGACMLLESEILRKHSFLSFQDPDKIAEALSFIWNEPHKWQVLSAKMGMDEKFVRTYLKNISIRRNQIVHEGDYSSLHLQRQLISEQDTKAVLDFISKLAEAIFNST